MKNKQRLFTMLKVVALTLTLGINVNAYAGLFGNSGDSWKEEVLLHDGQKIIVERSQTYKGRSEPGRSAPIGEHIIRFSLPGGGKTITWTSEYGEDLGRTNFNLLALHVLNGIPYIVASPNLCLSYNKWGRPNPPYVFFRYDGKEWLRIILSEFPLEFKSINVIVNNSRLLEIKKNTDRMGYVPLESIKEMNSSLRQPQYKTILREPLPKEQIEKMCMNMVPYKGSWVMPNDPIARKFIDAQQK